MRWAGWQAAVFAAAAAVAMGGPAPGQCAESAKLVAPRGAPEDHFGADVSLSGERALLGAPGSGNGPSAPGAAFVFALDGGDWVLEQELLANDGEAQDRFGSSVALAGAIALVGAPQDDDLGGQSGAAYVFRRQGSRWTQEQKLLASDGAAGAAFGFSVAVDDDRLLVGAWFANAVYVFRHEGGKWVEEQKLVPPDGSGTTFLGHAVSIAGDVAVGGGAAIDWKVGTFQGSAHVFRRDGAAWVHEQQLLVPAVQAVAFFGVPVALSGNALLVGAWLDPEQGAGAGSAFVFRHDGARWAHEQTIYATGPQTNDLFGCDVAISGDTAMIGARGDDSSGNGAGAAFVFRHDGAQWVQVQHLLASDGIDLDSFGVSVALAADGGLVGAPSADPAGANSGAAYVFACEQAAECPADVTNDGVVNVQDLLGVILAWGDCDRPCPADTNGDGTIDVQDLVNVVSAWGPC